MDDLKDDLINASDNLNRENKQKEINNSLENMNDRNANRETGATIQEDIAPNPSQMGYYGERINKLPQEESLQQKAAPLNSQQGPQVPIYTGPNYQQNSYYNESHYQNNDGHNIQQPRYVGPQTQYYGHGIQNQDASHVMVVGPEINEITQAEKSRGNKKPKWPAVVAIVLVLTIWFGSIAFAFYLSRKTWNKQNSVERYTVNPVTVSEDDVDNLNDVSDIAANALPSIVAVTTTIEKEYMTWGFDTRTVETPASGSGVIYSQTDESVFVVTNYHVVEGGIKVEVSWFDGTSCEATVKGFSKENDLALLEIKKANIAEATLKNLKVAVVGDSDKLAVGEGAIAIGNAMGYGQTVTEGIVSALNREVSFSDGYSMSLIQTSAAINPGNSGGALLNAKGELIGINCGKVASTTVEGIGYAIPVNKMTEVADAIFNNKTAELKGDGEVKLGITGFTITDNMAQTYNMPKGACVRSVDVDSVAEKAGIQDGDIITKFNDKDVTSMSVLSSIVKTQKSGDKATLTVYRQAEYVYKEIQIEVQF